MSNNEKLIAEARMRADNACEVVYVSDHIKAMQSNLRQLADALEQAEKGKGKGVIAIAKAARAEALREAATLCGMEGSVGYGDYAAGYNSAVNDCVDAINTMLESEE